MRRSALVMVVFACLVARVSRGRALARADGGARLPPRARRGRAASGVHADVVDGDRALRLRVDPPHRVLVRGLLGEPSSASLPTASGPTAPRRRPTRTSSSRRGTGWERLTTGHSLLWHDHRLAPPAALRPGESTGWSLPLVVDGRAAKLAGTFTRVAPPPLWPWLAAGLVALVALAAFARAAPRRRPETAAPSRRSAQPARSRRARPSRRATRSRDARSGSRSARPRCSPCSRRRRCSSANRSLRTWTAMVVGVVASALGARIARRLPARRRRLVTSRAARTARHRRRPVRRRRGRRARRAHADEQGSPQMRISLLLVAVLAIGASGCGSGSSTPKAPTIQAAHTYRLAGFEPAGKVEAGQAREDRVHDPAAEREAAHRLQARRRPAHRRPPDHGARRPEHDHPPASAGRRRRQARGDASSSPSRATTASSSTRIRT